MLELIFGSISEDSSFEWDMMICWYTRNIVEWEKGLILPSGVILQG
jgi:hypothetical protein